MSEKEKKEVFIQDEEQKRAQTVGLTELMRSQVLTMIRTHFEDLSRKYKTAYMEGFNCGFKACQGACEYEDN